MTDETLKVVANVEGLGKIVEIRGDFYSQLQQLQELGINPISPRDEAYARLKTRATGVIYDTTGKENIGMSTGTKTSAGFEYVKGKLPILRLE